MKTIRILPLVTLSAAAILAPALAFAQQSTTPANSDTATKSTAPAKPATPAKPDAQAKTDTPADPKKLEKLEEGEPPSIKIGKPAPEQKITETRDSDGVKEVKVQTGVSTYYVHPTDNVGTSLPGDVQSVHNRGAEWKVLEFDLGSKTKKTEKTDKSDDATPATPKDGSVTDEPKK